MILPMPIPFGQNEWFIIFSILILFIVTLSLPKRLTWMESVLILLFNCMLAKTTDYFIAAAFPFDLYDYNDTPKLDFFDELLQYILYPICGYLINYWYDVWRGNGFPRAVFVLLATSMSVLYEWFSVEAKVFTYKGWHLYDSAIAYLILISINIFVFHKLKKWIAQYRASKAYF